MATIKVGDKLKYESPLSGTVFGVAEKLDVDENGPYVVFKVTRNSLVYQKGHEFPVWTNTEHLTKR